MARASVTYAWADGNSVTCEVESAHEHPDALDEMVRRAFRLYTDVAEATSDTEADDDG